MITEEKLIDTDLLVQQQEIKARCYHPSGTVAEFTDADVEQSIPDRFEEQVRQHPDRIAVKTRAQEIRYAALNQWANQVAHLILAQLADRPEAVGAHAEGMVTDRLRREPGPVALLIDDDVLMIAGMLGVLKAGQIMLPLDPTMPLARVDEMVHDAGSIMVLASGRHLSLAQSVAQGRCPAINLDASLAHMPTSDPRLPIRPGTPAYIMYTSGSTGRPKGIVHSHRNVLHNVMNYTQNLNISPLDRLTLLHSFSFSSALVDIFTALLNGASVYPWSIKQEGMTGLAQWLAEEGVTVFSWSPTPYRHFMATLPEAASSRQGTKLPDLRVVTLGGEPVTSRDVDLYKSRLSDSCIFVNRLGTTETNNFRLFFVEESTQLPGGPVPVGYPVHGKEVLLLDEAGEPAGVDAVGEIAVKSRYLALGYWRRPQLTQASFRPAPAGDGERVYRTGDLGILRADGRLEYLGRKDFQVKIRGFRIETSEIELVLAERPEVKEAVVMPREDARDESYLVAYLVAADGVLPSDGELRQALAHRLPDYMIPAAFVKLEGLPLTPGGKVDRQALPMPDPFDSTTRSTVPGDGGFVAPRDEVERRLVIAWERVLGVSPVGVTDNFFELGGHSLSVVRLLVEVQRTFGIKIPPPQFYRFPTVEQLAERVREISGDGHRAGRPQTRWSPIVMLRSEQSGSGSRPPLFVLPGILGNVFTDLGDLARYLGPEQAVYAFQDGPGNPSNLEQHAALYVREVKRMQPEGPYLLAGICYGAVLAFEMAQQLTTNGQAGRGWLPDESQSTAGIRPQTEGVALLAMIEPARPMVPSLQTYLSYSGFLFDHTARRLARALKRTGEGEASVRVPRSPAEMSTFLRLKFKLAANAWALRRYAPRPYDGPVDIFFSQGSLQMPDNPQKEWYHFLRGKVRTHQIPGTHGSITGDNRVAIEPEHMEVLAAKLKARIDEVAASGFEPASVSGTAHTPEATYIWERQETIKRMEDDRVRCEA
jgi:amino acid adenylation domain-containing protein